MPNYRDLGYNAFGIKTIPTFSRETPVESKNKEWPGATTTFYAIRITKADGAQIFEVDPKKGWINIGPDQPDYNEDPLVPLYVTQSSDSYIAVNVQNPNTGTKASADIGVLNDRPASVTALSGLLDMGITSTTFSDPDFAVYGANACYLWSGDTEDLFIGSANPDGSIYFFTGGVDSTDYRNLQINSEGVVILKKASNATMPNYVEGGLYYNTDNHKLMVGGETGWEQVTSAPLAGFSISPSSSPSTSPSVSPSTSPSISPSPSA